MKLKLTEEELETMSYDDVAYAVLKHNKKKMKIQDLFKNVIEIMHLPESDFESHIGDFFGLISTDQRFLMLDKGFWDLKENHKTKVVIEEDDEVEEDIKDEIEEENEEDEEINYDNDDLVDDDETEDDLKDLVIIDDDETEDADNM